mmetsp:Transcript_29234/g.64319  ORF Transcript_29234/g.64319 Transcript_29234/m.64319 type:complete len:309 (-) Transcript_29234:5-931(-)
MSVAVKKVHLGSVDVTITQEQIRETFANLFGTVTDVHTPKDPRTGYRRNYAFVTFQSIEGFNSACAAAEVQIGQFTVTVKAAAQSGGDVPAKPEGIKYYVPGLPDWVTAENLKEYFTKYGTVVNSMVASENGQSRGFGYVTMDDTNFSESMLADKHVFAPATISVMVTKDSLESLPVQKVHMGNVPVDVTPEILKEALTSFGVVLDVHLPKDMTTGERKNFGFATFGSDAAYKAALQAGTLMIGGAEVTIKQASASDSKGKGKGKGGYNDWGMGSMFDWMFGGGWSGGGSGDWGGKGGKGGFGGKGGW